MEDFSKSIKLTSLFLQAKPSVLNKYSCVIGLCFMVDRPPYLLVEQDLADGVDGICLHQERQWSCNQLNRMSHVALNGSCSFSSFNKCLLCTKSVYILFCIQLSVLRLSEVRNTS